MPRVDKVLIVGGGISGLAAAILLRNGGVDVDVVEIKKDWKVYHVGIIVQSNLIRSLVSLGVADRCAAMGFPFQTMFFGNSNGTAVHGLPGPQLAGPKFSANLGLARP